MNDVKLDFRYLKERCDGNYFLFAVSTEFLCHAISSKRRVLDYVMDIFHQEKIGLNPLRGFFSPYTRNIHPPCSLPYTHVYYFFWFFQSPTAETTAWILTLKTSNDAVLRKEVPFVGYKSEITYLTEF